MSPEVSAWFAANIPGVALPLRSAWWPAAAAT